MMIEPNAVMDSIKAAATSVAPLPSIIPGLPDYEVAGEAGHRTLWVVFVLMTISMVIFVGAAWSTPVSKRLYHVITTLIVTFAALSYFAMATGQGVGFARILVKESHKHVPDTEHEIFRSVYHARSIDWCVTTPLLLLDLCLLAGLNGAQITIAIVADVIMILGGLFASYGTEGTPQKWGWYTIANLAYLVVIWQLAVNGRAAAMGKSNKVASFFAAIGGFTLIIWTAYPIVWGLAEGSRILSVDQEIIAYAVLDVLAKPIFGAWLLYTHARIPETNIELDGFWSKGLGGEGALRLGDDDDGA